MDPRLARMFDQYRSSPLFSSERALAQNADAPDRVDVAALAQGRIHEAWRRQALARQLISGADALEHALPALAVPDDDVDAPPTTAVRGYIVLAAAAALVAFAYALIASMHGAGLGATIRITDGPGREMRSRPELGPHRVVVTSNHAAYAALARVVDAKIVVEPVERDQLTLQLNAGEETLLPLDREITPRGVERWLVLLSAEPFDGVLADLFARAAAGDVPRGCELREILVHAD